MAQVFGSLREDRATYGEKKVLKLLKENLPKEYDVYVECPLPAKRDIRHPDFIVSTNYGVIVLEVKDWVQVTEADRYGAKIRTRENREREVRNPVEEARQYALLLNEKLNENARRLGEAEKVDVPWGYAVVLPNLPASVISQLRSAWGEEFVFSTEDLRPDLIHKRLKVTLPQHRVRNLRKRELDYIRTVINPVVLIEMPERAVILDRDQEEIVTEPAREPAPEQPKEEKPKPEQGRLFETAAEPVEPAPDEEALSTYEADISRNTAIRLVRGVAGSGKSLVLAQRTRYLAALYPEWDIVVLTYNDGLCRQFAEGLKGLKNVRALTFHKLCMRLLKSRMSIDKTPTNSLGWLKHHRTNNSLIQELTPEFLRDEFDWINEMGLDSRQAYLEIERKGRGGQRRLNRQVRAKVYDLFLEYRAYLKAEGLVDWSDLPLLVLKGLDEGSIQPTPFDAILIDEAQDFAPVWIQVVKRLLNPQGGLLFLADDPAQSIYRFYSWREKGVPVVGRTRRLKVPYRNTFEIYQAAYRLICDDKHLQHALGEEGLLVVPDLSSSAMRRGPKPLMQRFESFDQEALAIRDRITGLLQEGVSAGRIAVLHRRTSGVRKLQSALKGLDVTIGTFHGHKGLEYEVVFLAQMQETFDRCDSPEDLSEERRLVYMAMTRARQQLFMGYQGRLPAAIRELGDTVDWV